MADDPWDIFPDAPAGPAAGQPAIPRVIQGPPREPPPQTATQAALDQAQLEKAQRDLREPPKATPGQNAIDTEFAKDYVAYKTGGGFSDVRKQLNQLRETSKILKTSNVTGPIVGMVPDRVMAAVNPQAITARENVEEVVQRALRQILGAQFTEKEGERLIARAYNPKLPENENRKRVARLRIQLTQAAMAKDDASRYFEKHGTLKGWDGKLWSFNDFDVERDSVLPPKAGSKPQGGPRVIDFNDLPE